MSGRWEEVEALRRRRTRSPFLRISALLIVLIVLGGWITADVADDLLSERRLANLDRFLSEVRPYPLQGREFDLGILVSWAGDYFRETGAAALSATLSISVAAIVLAALGGGLLSLLAARTLSTAEPFLPAGRKPPWVKRLLWSVLKNLTRAFLVIVRALPEYVMGFVLLVALGPTPWTAVLAIGLHNLGSYGRLSAETIENLPPGVPRALRGLGARRLQIFAAGVFPVITPRFLLYFFYRFESCVREATVLGLLGIVSLGYFIEDARARNHYDEMFFLVLLGSALVIAGDVASAVARGLVRRSG
jgi:phosphonate transport system permease protein